LVAQLEDAVFANRAEELLGLMQDLLPDFQAVAETPAQSAPLAGGAHNLPYDKTLATSVQSNKVA
jgi:hypothetical protein